ncbi:AhpC/TSA family protein [Dysgonomonas sp. Marseille-P4677]|uniref:redoxin domain-containing protein n=1 Tax=Dysgonomonas sp. Marseille-P4677 TaxID=2364790 RepID=UPI001913A4F1|nr:redoxin domain-containing protein [Dysgonomonas sp. Marseille-P4677]MBK5720782.1 AhpC/TSA family protein [Dysgonomonas sp. Marseille-P4677]
MSKIKILIYTGLLLLFIVIITASCDRNSNTYEVSGQLENVSGDYFYISHESGDSIIIDTIRINPQGEFSFKAEIDTLTELSLYFNQNTKSTFILANKGWKIELKGDVLFPDLIEAKGGEVNDDLTEFKNKNKTLLKSRADILNQAQKGITNNDSLVVKDYVVELKNINFELSNIAAAYIKANPDKIASVMLMNTFFKDESSIPRLDESLSLLRGKAVDFYLTAELKNFRDRVKMSAVNSIAPSFSLKDVKGKNIQLADYRGKYTLLMFIATTCEACLDEKKDAVAVYDNLKKQKKNIEFISIVKDIEKVPLSKNITDTIKWPILPVMGGWSAKQFDIYYIREIPYNILISPTGLILERDLPIQAVEKKINELTETK